MPNPIVQRLRDAHAYQGHLADKGDVPEPDLYDLVRVQLRVEEIVLGRPNLVQDDFPLNPAPVNIKAALSEQARFARERGANTAELDELDACHRRIEEILETRTGAPIP